MTVVRRSLREQIRDALLQRILDGTYQPDERLRELQLAGEFGSSQAPVREALRELETMQYVTSLPNRGTRVRRMAPEEMRDAYEVRAGLELVAARAAARRPARDWRPLRRAASAIVRAAHSNDLEAYAHHDDAFHRGLVDAAENPVLLRQWEQLLVATRVLLVIQSGAIDLTRAAAEHEPIIDAVASHDAELAGARAFNHASQIATRLGQPRVAVP